MENFEEEYSNFFILILIINEFILIKGKAEENNCIEIKYVTASEYIYT